MYSTETDRIEYSRAEIDMLKPVLHFDSKCQKQREDAALFVRRLFVRRIRREREREREQERKN